MNRRTLGLVMTLVGFGLAGVGVVGALASDDGTAPDAAPSTPAEPASSEPAPTQAAPSEVAPTETQMAAFAGSQDDPAGDLFDCGSATPVADGPAHLDVVAVTVRDGTNPVTGEPSTNLLLELAGASASPDVSFQARVAVEPGGRLPDGVQVMEWLLVYAGGDFERQSVELRGDAVEEGPVEDFRIRYEGFGDRVEIEFYGPVGTVYSHVTMTDAAVCDTVLPAATPTTP